MNQNPTLSTRCNGLRRSLRRCLYAFICFNTTHAISILPPSSIPYQNNKQIPPPLPAYYGMTPTSFNSTQLPYNNEELNEMYKTMILTMSVASILYLIKKITHYCLEPLPNIPPTMTH